MSRGLAVFLGVSFLSSSASAGALLRPGVFAAEAVPPDADGAWLGLVVDGTGASLRPVEVRVRDAHRTGVDGPWERSGRAVTVDEPATRVLARGIDGLRPGPAPEWPATAVGDVTVVASPEGRVVGVLEPVFDGPDAGVWWVAGGRRTRVAAAPPDRAEGAAARLLWAGDLDRDARVDLVLDVEGPDRTWETWLILSSASEAGPTATFRPLGT